LTTHFFSFKAYEVTANADHIEELMQWQYEEDVDFWRTGAAGTWSRVMIPPHLQEKFENFLTSNKIEHKVIVEDVGNVEKEFEVERVERLEKKKAKSAIENFSRPDFEVYWTTEEMDAYCRYLAETYPQLVQREVLVQSFGGRDVFALKISRGGFGGKPIFFMDGGMHAREWVSQASLMYFLNRLVEDPATSNELLNNLDWIIIPNLNPGEFSKIEVEFFASLKLRKTS
jgi:carboxypeptidase A2